MTLDTNAAVERINKVQDSDGNDRTPANENRQQAIQEAVGNPAGATIETHTTDGTAAEQLPDLPIPDGVTALVVYLPGNAGDVFLGDDSEQFVPLTDSGHVFEWEGATTADLYIKTNTAGDGVGIVFEGGA
ncbi:hypothetical protein [Haloarcula sp. CBA1129]|uniref:hypothetical protein n=1 Tax=Haloarcula sp. CBA1129 TaxID=1853684 RepID=UPI00124685AB|nr:hypothetical protein [Haloarcula sp. CBA1129]KAA9399680.1 hypothetical protein Har1129_16225 [Haloarcula sp. CBA1129]